MERGRTAAAADGQGTARPVAGPNLCWAASGTKSEEYWIAVPKYYHNFGFDSLNADVLLADRPAEGSRFGRGIGLGPRGPRTQVAPPEGARIDLRNLPQRLSRGVVRTGLSGRLRRAPPSRESPRMSSPLHLPLAAGRSGKPGISGTDDCNRLQSNAADCGREEPAGQLTDRKPFLSGWRHFLAMFALIFGLGSVFFSVWSADVPHNENFVPALVVWGCVAAYLALVEVVHCRDFRVRRPERRFVVWAIGGVALFLVAHWIS